jgi:hypothetical protein
LLPTDWTIRAAIRDIIAAADTTGVVLPKFVLDVIVGENANLLKPTSGADSGRIHGWMITRGRVSNSRVGSVRWDDATTATSYRLDSVLSYRIWFLYRYAHGDEAADTDSTETFLTILDDVIEAFALKPRLNVGTSVCGGASNIKRHLELQIEEDPDIVAMGSEWAHFAPCRLDIELYRTPAD